MKILQTNLSNNSFDQFIIRTCGFLLILRLLILNLFPDNFIFTKERLSDLIIAGLIFMISLIMIVFQLKTKKPLQKTPVDFPILILFLAICISLFHASDLSVSINALIPFTSGIFLFYILSNTLKNLESHLHFLNYLIICALITLIFGIWEYWKIPMPDIGTTHRIGSLFGWPNLFAGFLMLILPLVWAKFILSSKKIHKIIFLLLLTICLCVFLLTFSFLCSVNFILTTVILLPIFLKSDSRITKAKAFTICLFLVLLCILLLILKVRHDFSITARYEYLKTCFQLLKDNPLFGFGFNNFDLVNRQYVNYFLGFSSYVHNSYLQFWVETGLIGFIAVIALVCKFIQQARQALQKELNTQRRILLIALIWSISIFFVDNLTNFTLLRSSTNLFAWSILAMFCALWGESRTNKKTKTLSFILIIIICCLLFLIVRISLGLLAYNQGSNLLANKQRASAYLCYQQAKQFDPIEFRYPSAMGFVRIQDYFYSKDANLLDEAQSEFLKAKELSPLTSRTYEILGNIALEKGDSNKAQEYFSQAKKICPLKYTSESKI